MANIKHPNLSFWAYGFICGWPRPVSSRSAKQPGWRSPPIVTIVTIVTIKHLKQCICTTAASLLIATVFLEQDTRCAATHPGHGEHDRCKGVQDLQAHDRCKGVQDLQAWGKESKLSYFTLLEPWMASEYLQGFSIGACFEAMTKVERVR